MKNDDEDLKRGKGLAGQCGICGRTRYPCPSCPNPGNYQRLPPVKEPEPQSLQHDGWKANLNRVLLDLVYQEVMRTKQEIPPAVFARLLKGRDYYARQFREMWGENAPLEDFRPIMANVLEQFQRVIREKAA